MFFCDAFEYLNKWGSIMLAVLHLNTQLQCLGKGKHALS